MSKIITATLHNISSVPTGSTYHGDGMFEFSVEIEPPNITKKYAEYDTVTKTYYKDPSIATKKLTADTMVVKK